MITYASLVADMSSGRTDLVPALGMGQDWLRPTDIFLPLCLIRTGPHLGLRQSAHSLCFTRVISEICLKIALDGMLYRCEA